VKEVLKMRIYRLAIVLLAALSVASTVRAQSLDEKRSELQTIEQQIHERRVARALSAEAREAREVLAVAEQEYQDAISAIPEIRQIDAEADRVTQQLIALRRRRQMEVEKHQRELAGTKSKRDVAERAVSETTRDDEQTRQLVERQHKLLDELMAAERALPSNGEK